MVVGILGPGRLGGSMAQLLRARGYEVRTWSRGQQFPDCDVAWLTVSDHAIGPVAAALPVGPVVLHASGATDLEPLQKHPEHGSLHPLQSFPGVEVSLPPVQDVPAAIAGTPEAKAIARRLATDIGFHPFEVPGDRRLYHAAAVVAGNFGTTLLHAAAQLLADAGVEAIEAPRLLAPLAIASIRQAAEKGPAAALTGPHARGDREVVAAHQAAIDEVHPGLSALYTELSERTFELASCREEEG